MRALLSIPVVQVAHDAARLEHLPIRDRQRLAGEPAAAGVVDDLVGRPVDLDVVPALHEGEDAGTGDLRKAHCDLAAPVAGRKTFGDHAGDAQVAHRDHRWIVRMTEPEIAGTDQKIAGPHLGCEFGIVLRHRDRREFGRIAQLDVLDADDLIDVEVDLREDEGDSPAKIVQCHRFTPPGTCADRRSGLRSKTPRRPRH
jgi:hypothetical protein